MLPPQTMTAMRSPGRASYEEDRTPASAAAPPGSATTAEIVPEDALRRLDGLVRYQHHALDVRLRDREGQRPHPPGGQGIGGDPARLRIHGGAGGEGRGQGRRLLRLDPDHAHRARVPGGDPADEPPATDRRHHRVQLGHLGRQLGGQAPRPEHRLPLVVGVHRHRARARDPFLAGGEGVGYRSPPITRSRR